MLKINHVRIPACLILLLLSPMWIFSQNNLRVGDWNAYLSHSFALRSVERNGTIYTITQGGMFSFDMETRETRNFSTIEGMSGINPTTIYHAKDVDIIFIGYENGMVDYLTAEEKFGYFTDIERNTFYTRKRINAFASQGNRLYIATDFGIVIYDLQAGLPETDITQFGDNPTRLAVTSMALYDNQIWAMISGAGLYSAPVDFPNLKDPSIWSEESGFNGLPVSARLRQVVANSDRIMVRVDTTVYERQNGDWQIFSDLDQKLDRIILSDEAIIGTSITRSTVINFSGPRYTYFLGVGVQHTLRVTESLFYTATAGRGLVEFNAWELADISPDGPKTNDCLRVAAGNGEFYVAPKGYDQALAPDRNTLGVYYFSPATGWKSLDRASGTLDPSVSTSFARGIYDETTSTAWMASWGSGIVEFRNGEQQAFYHCENSGLSVINPPCDLADIANTRVSGMDFDQEGNLWVSLDFAKDPLVMRTPNGQWLSANSAKIPNNDHFIEMIVDEYGSKWILNDEQGILIYNDNKTPTDMEDDWTLQLKSGINNGNLPNNVVTSIAKDLEGFIWVGTTAGVVVFYDPFSISERKIVDARPPVFERRPLLKDAVINAIAVDGGNRKWIATNDGVFLVSEDGDQLIHQFTEENSPLLSNVVNDVSIDQSTGEVFFATSRGLISIMGDATQGARQCDDVLVFPNPVFTDYDGLISIEGSATGSVVKITTVSGLLVNEIQSEGGRAIWDGRDVYGNKVRSGIYLALIADRNGEEACIGKFAVIAR